MSLSQKDSWRGWTVVGAAFVGMLLGVGVLVVYSFGVLGSAMKTDLGWTDVQRSTIFVVFSISVTIAGPIWGAIADRVGSRKVVLTSAILLAGCFGLTSLISQNPIIAYLAFIAAGVLGAGTLPPTFANVVVGWFDRHRGLALGVSMLGVGLGAAIFPVIAATVTANFGWRTTFLVYAALILIVAVPTLAFLLRAFPESAVIGQAPAKAPRPPLMPIMRETRTGVLLIFSFLTGAVMLACITNFVPLLESRGETLVSAAKYQSILGMSLIAGRILTGALLDRLFAPRVMSVVLLVTAGGIAVFSGSDSGLSYVLAAIGIGLAVGAEVDFLGFMVSKYYERSAFTTIFAFMFAAYSFGASIGPLLFSWLVQRTGGPDHGLLICSLVILAVSASLFLLPRYAKE